MCICNNQHSCSPMSTVVRGIYNMCMCQGWIGSNILFTIRCEHIYNIIHGISNIPRSVVGNTSGHITLSGFFASASLSGCVVVGWGGCRGMLLGPCSRPMFLFRGGCTKSLSSLLGSVWIFNGCEAFFLAGTIACKRNFFCISCHFVVWCEC
jgi:hypothetical protein